MISFEEANEKVMESAIKLPTETVSLENSLGRVLAQNVLSDIDMPPFNKSAMDGYACRREDLQKELTIIETIPAGYTPQVKIGPNQCSKIMTGAMVPEGADTVIMLEYTKNASDKTIFFTQDDTKPNICYQAEDVKIGDKVLARGSLINPEHIAVMAAVGCANPQVSRKPKVGIISTGSELVEPTELAIGAKIRNSNGWQLAAQAAKMGAQASNYGIVKDTEAALNLAIKKALAENDVIILSGGVSMGDFDLVPGVLKNNGVEILFNKVAIQPGNPSTFGVVGNTRCFGLPGNPVSTFVQFELLIKPFLYKMMGHDFKSTIVPGEVTEEITRRKAMRASITPVTFVAPSKISKIDYHGSAHISAMCQADGIIIIPVGETCIKQGTTVDVRLL